MTSPYARLSVNIGAETALALRLLADREEISVTDVVHRAIGTYYYIKGEIQDGKSIRIKGGRGDERELVLL